MMRNFLLAQALGVVSAAAVSPVVLVPGDGSNQLEARLDKPSTVSIFCQKKADWFRLWLSASQLLLGTSCWADNIKLLYDEEHDTLSNNLGVETRVPDFGGTSSLEELDPDLPLHASGAFRKMVLALTAGGHVRNVTLRGAPYDFRYAPSSPVGAAYTARLKALIEETAQANGGARVSLVSHSMGCLQVLYLLNTQTQAWKDQFIERWIPLSGPFGGATKEMRLHASGDNEGLPVESLLIREEQRSYETNFWLAPVSRWFGERVLVSTPQRNYTAAPQDLDAFFEDIGYPAGKKLYKRTQDLTSSVTAPGVDVVCMYSLGVNTPSRFVYGEGGFDKKPELVPGDGDGTVDDFSLRLCERWTLPGAQARSAQALHFSKVKHADMLTNDAVLKALLTHLGIDAESALAAAQTQELLV